MPTPDEIVKTALAGVTVEKPVELPKPTDLTVALPTPKAVAIKDEIKTKPAQWETEDGLPPRYIGGNLTPVNAKKR